ncbi:MAG: 50S ribosomal protein L10 [Patescibacteria group bacterium]
MAISREKKTKILAKLEERLAAAETVVFVNFHGLAVNSVNELRRALEAMKVGYVVAKKTLIRRALETQSRFKGEIPTLDGEVAIATGADPILPAKGVYEFKQKVKEGIKILGGVFGGEYVSAEKMEQIAAIPAREVLYGQLVNLINYPIAGLVIALSEIAKQREVTSN